MTSNIESRLSRLEERMSNIEKILSNGSPNKKNKKPTSFRELISKKNPQSKLYEILIAGYFIEHYLKEDFFNAKDLDSLLKRAKIKPPTNINDMVNKNIKNNFMMEAAKEKNGKKAWVLTKPGEEHVENMTNKK